MSAAASDTHSVNVLSFDVLMKCTATLLSVYIEEMAFLAKLHI